MPENVKMNSTLYKIGFWAGLAAFVSTIAYCIVQLLQVAGLLHFPVDEIMIYGTSLCIVIPFILTMLSFHYITPVEKKFWSHAALVFTVLYAVFVTANYVVQLATIIPLKIKGSLNEAAVLEQTPHSMFWNFDALGYIFLGLATLIAVPALEKQGFQKWVRLSLLANGLVTPFIAFVYFYPDYSETILMLGYPWAVTAPLSMLMLTILFYNKENPDRI
jgi:hypothetical protein